MITNRHQKSTNHDAAPIAGRFVEDMRKVFGESVRVTYVKEGATKMGKKDDRQWYEYFKPRYEYFKPSIVK